jgi:hypothetical protein
MWQVVAIIEFILLALIGIGAWTANRFLEDERF